MGSTSTLTASLKNWNTEAGIPSGPVGKVAREDLCCNTISNWLEVLTDLKIASSEPRTATQSSITAS